MVTVRVQCDDCGILELTVDDLTIRADRDELIANYSFRCPHCRFVTVRQISRGTVDLLTDFGVDLFVVHPPRECRPPGGDTISHDELIDFHRAIMSCDDLVDAALND